MAPKKLSMAALATYLQPQLHWFLSKVIIHLKNTPAEKKSSVYYPYNKISSIVDT